MNIFIMTDMECVSGISCDQYLDVESPYYQKTRESLTKDVNAAAEGCFQAGAKHVYVKDGHGKPNNLILEKLDPRIEIFYGLLDNWSGLSERFDATMIIGQHAKAGTLDAFLEHTQSSAEIFDHCINNISLGELGQWALMAGHFNIPLIFLTGDNAGCREAEELIKGIKTVSVGSACGRQKLSPRNQNTVLQEITEQSNLAVKNLASGKVKPYKMQAPYTVKLTFMRSDQADQNCRLKHDRKRIDGRTVEMTVDSPMKILSIFA